MSQLQLKIVLYQSDSRFAFKLKFPNNITTTAAAVATATAIAIANAQTLTNSETFKTTNTYIDVCINVVVNL